MEVERLELDGVLLIKPRAFGDRRGWFFESFRSDRLAEHGVVVPFVQDNVSKSAKNTVRGLHFQDPHAQGKLVSVLSGTVFDVAVDIRPSSPTFGKWLGRVLDDRNHWQLYVPPGFAHGFSVLSDEAIFHYKCTDYYAPDAEHGIAWDDTDLAIDWRVADAIVSEKDQRWPTLAAASLR